MSVLIVDEPMSVTLDRADGPVQVCTRDGRVLGYFSPAKPKTLRLDPPIGEDEIRRIEAEGGGRPLADILRDLEKRA